MPFFGATVMLYAPFCILQPSSNGSFGRLNISWPFLIWEKSQEKKENYLIEKLAIFLGFKCRCCQCQQNTQVNLTIGHFYSLLTGFLLKMMHVQHMSMVTSTMDQLRRKWKVRKGEGCQVCNNWGILWQLVQINLSPHLSWVPLFAWCPYV